MRLPKGEEDWEVQGPGYSAHERMEKQEEKRGLGRHRHLCRAVSHAAPERQECGSREERFLLTMPREKAGKWATADPSLGCSQSGAKGGPRRTPQEGPLGKGLSGITVAEQSKDCAAGPPAEVLKRHQSRPRVRGVYPVPGAEHGARG